MPIDQVNGTGLYWERHGAGPRLLYCNGSGTDLRAVQPLLTTLAARFDVLSWDYRGLGGSAPLTAQYTMADLAADAAGLLGLAGWDSCRVFGMSFGGMVAQEFAVTYPARVERLGLAATSPGGDGGSSYPLQDLARLPERERLAAQLRLTDSRWTERWLAAHPADQVLAGYLTTPPAPPDPATAAARQAQLAARAGHDVWDRLSLVSCPALVGYGRYDGIAPAPNATALASRLRQAGLCCYEGGHLFLYQDPGALPEFEEFLLA